MDYPEVQDEDWKRCSQASLLQRVRITALKENQTEPYSEHLHFHGLYCGKRKHFPKAVQLIFPPNPNNFLANIPAGKKRKRF